MTAELGTIIGLSFLVVRSDVDVARRMGRVEGRMAVVGRSLERLPVDMNRLRDDMDRSREDVKAIFLRLPEKAT